LNGPDTVPANGFEQIKSTAAGRAKLRLNTAADVRAVREQIVEKIFDRLSLQGLARHGQ
jgi:hypothetical protein